MEEKNSIREQRNVKGPGSRENPVTGGAVIVAKKSLLPGRGSNKWFLIGLIHGLLLSIALSVVC